MHQTLVGQFIDHRVRQTHPGEPDGGIHTGRRTRGCRDLGSSRSLRPDLGDLGIAGPRLLTVLRTSLLATVPAVLPVTLTVTLTVLGALGMTGGTGRAALTALAFALAVADRTALKIDLFRTAVAVTAPAAVAAVAGTARAVGPGVTGVDGTAAPHDATTTRPTVRGRLSVGG
ncbi:hypothetical protein CVA01_23580 [Corynebacterium variabile]|uniref:Uncharacterized protein n=1 Tax=Corynebacterium variabile TaxID=1727 RepID=A0A4Y4C6L4_9CORY|nr:hypothetical protein CVA01_23580 [Corynebacterium variabile]